MHRQKDLKLLRNPSCGFEEKTEKHTNLSRFNKRRASLQEIADDSTTNCQSKLSERSIDINICVPCAKVVLNFGLLMMYKQKSHSGESVIQKQVNI